ncbi:MAG TPA: hypothetical protein VHT52_02455, partial [Stellaceae bacterium]|nr:hypothetical protein [Stellaceae bacterium]
LGMRFYTGKMFPKEYRNAIFVVRHGSWNRSKKIGGDVVVARLNQDGTVKSIEPFVLSGRVVLGCRSQGSGSHPRLPEDIAIIGSNRSWGGSIRGGKRLRRSGEWRLSALRRPRELFQLQACRPA